MSSSALAKYRHVIFITTKAINISLNPAQRCNDVERAKVCDCAWTRIKRWVAKPTEGAKAVIERDNHHVLLCS